MACEHVGQCSCVCILFGFWYCHCVRLFDVLCSAELNAGWQSLWSCACDSGVWAVLANGGAKGRNGCIGGRTMQGNDERSGLRHKGSKYQWTVRTYIEFYGQHTRIGTHYNGS